MYINFSDDSCSTFVTVKHWTTAQSLIPFTEASGAGVGRSGHAGTSMTTLTCRCRYFTRLLFLQGSDKFSESKFCNGKRYPNEDLLLAIEKVAGIFY